MAKIAAVRFPKKSQVKNAATIGELSRLMGEIVICAAAVQDFHIAADTSYYAPAVEGKLDDARKIVLTRFKRASEAGAKTVKGSGVKSAQVAYRKERDKWAKRNKLDIYPKHLVKVTSTTAKYSKKRPKKIETPFGGEAGAKTPFE